MRRQFGFVALMASTILFSAQVAATEKMALLQKDRELSRSNESALPAKIPTEDDLVQVPMQKPEIGPVALLNIALPPLPQKRPMGIQLPPSPMATGLLSKKDLKIYREAFAAAEEWKWGTAREIAARATYRLPAKIIDWRWMTAYRNMASFDQITRFIDENPDWPQQETLQRRAEEALDNPVGPEKTLAWFNRHKPVTGIGMYRYGEALAASGKKNESGIWIKRAWSVGSFSKDVENEIRRDYKGLFTQTDHENRLDHLLWERNTTAAKRLFPYVSAGAKKLAIARISLMQKSRNVDRAVRAVPEELQNDPGLIFERAKWRRRKSLGEESRDLLFELDKTAPRADKWWPERHVQARKLLGEGHISEAYQLASQHGLGRGEDFASAEWLSGWVALEFLEDGEMALYHFVRLYENVSYPISRARGAYWIGRAKFALGDKIMAQYWYKVAAQYYTTFYGQMALHELGQSQLPPIPEVSTPSERALKSKSNAEQILVVRHLAELGMSKWTKPFLLELAEKATSEDTYVYLAELADKIGRPDYAVAIAKRASQLGTELTEISWPTPDLKLDNPPIESALMLAIARQESAFATDAISGAGARGLMQLMPGTAKHVSRRLNVNYSKTLLTEDPAYNALLGSSYLANLIDEFDGSYVLAIAAYNAGPSNVRNWLKDRGDPRAGDLDMIDWIEFIPFSETRNYVQRVIENLQVYRERLARNETGVLRISQDINRGVVTH
ncbi:MAG: lytic transglycosylase domain-containing protein [Sneathiella sp.]|nr:lytic transglycosylase domain-containing protein [Sneathiella sp.]